MKVYYDINKEFKSYWINDLVSNCIVIFKDYVFVVIFYIQITTYGIIFILSL